MTVPLTSRTARQALVERLYDSFYAAGFDWKTAQEVKPQPCMWARPPLFTPLMLGDVPAQTYLNVHTPLAVDELADVYERFIAWFLYVKNFSEPTDLWLKRELKLGYYTTRSLFVRAKRWRRRLGVHMNLVQFAAIVAYNHNVTVERGPATFAVTTPRQGFSFGIRNGELVSNLIKPRRSTPCLNLSHHDGLEHMPRGKMEASVEISLFDTLKTWIAQQTPTLGSLGHAMHLGVEILRWRSAPGVVPGQLRLLTAYEYSKDALVETCAIARQYERFDDPLVKLRHLFTPFLRYGEFEVLFGSLRDGVPTPVPERVRRQWDRSINALDPQYSDETI